ncbi:MAG: adenylyltransferase/cytidyltransferase family protein [Chlamydiia bacterium]|nr:adenylyltransferase/cytidyltransferase family protein [Chlamydiia bacterium]
MVPVRVYVDGIFDLFHAGHEKLFYKAKAKAQEFFPGREVQLLVGVCDDEVEQYKRKTVMSYEERTAAVRASQVAHEVFWADLTLTEEYIKEHDIHLVIHGDDFGTEKQKMYYGPAVERGIFTTVPYEAGVSTTQLMREAKNEGRFSIDLSKTLIASAELVRRIQERSLEQLKI